MARAGKPFRSRPAPFRARFIAKRGNINQIPGGTDLAERQAGARREMGPALLPTPLSPAVGSRRNAYRLTFRAPARRRAALCRPALAPVPVPSGAKSDPKILPYHPAVPRPVVVPGFSSGPASPRTCNSSKPGRFVRPFRLRAFAASTLRELTDPKTSRFPLLHPAASRGRVESGSKISSFFRVLPRPSEEPIPALDGLKMRPRDESGKLSKP